jgi:diadenosine tetraphosphate (Ap4A) HIT family hydrolase
MGLTIPERLDMAHAGTNPTILCKVPSGWAAMCDMQYLRGYAILTADPEMASINDLTREKRIEFLADMTLVGDALLTVTGAFRVNYAIMGNVDAYLHAHIVPRYLSEPVEYRKNSPWSYPGEVMEGRMFDVERDRGLMDELARALQARAGR